MSRDERADADAPRGADGAAEEAAQAPSRDRHARPLRSLRISVTDRCNLRCGYCMPEERYTWLPRADLLTFEEIATVAGVFADLGVDRVRLTGGEPLLRRDLPTLVAALARDTRLRDLALTTNAVLLPDLAGELREAGLHRLSISLDTLRPDRFRQLTRNDDLDLVLRGIDAAAEAGFRGTKLDCVVMRGVNEDELVDLVEFGRARDLEVRFIEYMDVGGATRWSSADVFSEEDILRSLAAHYGPLRPAPSDPSAPARRYRLPDGLELGVIASTTRPFCAACDRSRLTADGRLLLCLYARTGIDLRPVLRSGAGRDALRDAVAAAWGAREDRGAEERLAERDRAALVAPEVLREDPHLEMHTRGG